MAYMCYQANRDPKTGLYKPSEYTSSIQPFEPKVFDPKNYRDPLKDPIRTSEYREFKPTEYKISEFKPVTTVRTYELPNIDPLTGRPRRPRKVVVNGKEVNLDPPKKPEKEKKKVQIKPVVVRPLDEIQNDLRKRKDIASTEETEAHDDKHANRQVNEYIKMLALLKERSEKKASITQPETLDI